MLRDLCRSKRALLRSQSGPGASHLLTAAPTSDDCSLTPEIFQAALRRRLRWPLPLATSHCDGCSCEIDPWGDHLSACMRSGRPKLRSLRPEATVAQICREAGGRVKTNVMLRDMNIAVPAADERRLEVLVSGLPVFGGSQLAVDVTLRSCLTRDGVARANAHWSDGACAEGGREDKEAKYPELISGERCRLVVLAVELGGRFSVETCEFIRQLAGAKAQTVPAHLRHSTAIAFERRWSRMLAVSVSVAHLESLLLDKEVLATSAPRSAREPWLQALLTESRAELRTGNPSS